MKEQRTEIAENIRKASIKYEFPTLQSARVFEEVLPDVADLFLEKNKDYGDAAVHLGAKGQFADMNRKFWKMKSALWDGKKLSGEPIEEVVRDMIGHCLLTLLFLLEETEEPFK